MKKLYSLWPGAPDVHQLYGQLSSRRPMADPLPRQGYAWAGLLLVCLLLAGNFTLQAQQVPGSYTASWLGNTFSGSPKHINHNVESMYVSGDTVFTNTYWDEAYKNMMIIKDGDLLTSSLGNISGGLGGYSVTANSKYIYQAVALRGTANGIRRVDRAKQTHFDYTEVNTGNAGEGSLGNLAGMAIDRDNRLYVSDPSVNMIKVYDAETMAMITSWPFNKPHQMAVNKKDNTLWIIEKGDKVLHYEADGTLLGHVIDLENPTAVAADKNGKVYVTDNGPDKQVKVFSETGVFEKSIGTKGGIGAAAPTPPGVMHPSKFFGLTGVGVDDAGNLYVSCWEPHTTVVRKLTPDASVSLWEVYATAFVDVAGFDPATDGKDIYGVDEHFVMDYSQPAGQEATWESYTLDLVKYPKDPRVGKPGSHPMTTAWIRRPQGPNGAKVMFVTGMFPQDDLEIYKFDGEIAVNTGKIDISNWSVSVDKNGNAWYVTDAIYKVPFTGFAANGDPQFGAPQKVSEWIQPFREVQRIIYDVDADVLYLSGYTDEPGEWWGQVGKVLARYDHWSTGNRNARYMVNLPYDINVKEPTPHKTMTMAGDYLFMAGVQTKGRVYVYRAADGAPVGHMTPGDIVGGVDNTGWIDIPYGIDALKKSNGDYLILLEEDFKAKNLLYTWTPGSLPEDQVTLSSPKSLYLLGEKVKLDVYVNDTDKNTAKVELYNGTSLVGTDATAPYNFEFSNLPRGDYKYNAKAYDGAGQVVSTSAELPISVIDLPDLIVTDVKTVPANPKAGEEVRFEVMVKNQGTGDKLSGLIIGFPLDLARVGGGGAARVVGDTTARLVKAGESIIIYPNTAGNGTGAWVPASGGQYTLNVRLDDINRIRESNENNNSFTKTICVGTVTGEPFVFITAPANNANFPGGSNVTLQATAADCDGAIAKVEFYNGESLLGTVTAAPYNFTITNAAAGTYNITAKAYDNEGKTSAHSVSFVALPPRKPDTPELTTNGLNYAYYEETWRNLPTLAGFSAITPKKTGSVSNFSIADRERGDNFGFKYEGYVDVPETGLYTFFTTSDDGSILWIGDTKLVDNDGPHGPQERSGQISLEKGKHKIIVGFAELGGGEMLEVRYEGPGISKRLIPSTVLYRDFSGVDVSCASPASNAVFETGSTVSVEVRASSAKGTVTKVELWAGDRKIGEKTAAPYHFVWNDVPAGTHILKARATDNQGSTETSGPLTIQVRNLSGAGLLREQWDGIGGRTINDLTSNANFPDKPSSISIIPHFELPANVGDNYGVRVRGYVTAPTTGDYTFWIASDDFSELWLSMDENPANKVRIANVSDWTNPREWEKYPSQKSALIPLTAGKMYYVEVLYKEGGGGDNMAVGWQLPGGAMERPIMQNRLTPFTATLPDLAVEQFNWSPSGATLGDAVSFTAIVKNTGNVATPAGRALKLNFIVDDHLLEAISVTDRTLAPGESLTFSATQTWTASLGEHVFRAVADPDNQLVEVDERNNLKIQAVTIRDIQPPTIPQNLASGNLTPYSVALSWAASTDNVGVAGYEVFRDGVKVGTTAEVSYPVSGLRASQSYAFTVKAFDAAGNVSAASQALTVKTPAPASRRYEAEDAFLYRAMAFNTPGGYSGTGFVRFPSNEGNYVEWTVQADFSGMHKLGFVYANGQKQEQGFRLEVNGAVVQDNVVFGYTGIWNTWATVETTVFLPEGSHKIRLSTPGAKVSNLDYLQVTDPMEISTQAAAATARVAAAGAERTLPELAVELYPNPATEGVTVKFTAPAAGKALILVSDMLSRPIQQREHAVQAGSNELRLQTGTLANGTYLIQVLTGHGRQVKKLQVRR